MTTGAQGIQLINAWDRLLELMEDAGEQDSGVLRDFYVIHSLGGFQVWPELAREMRRAAALLRDAVRVQGGDGSEEDPK